MSGAIKFVGFFQCQEANGQVLLHELEELCSNAEVPELYVPKFRNNYYQMKIDGVKTYGKVFEDDGKVVNVYSCAVTPPVRQTGNRLSRPAETANASLLA